jgi:peptide/nickel transport system ATP-binding protein/oligopeptide transport system ATP-binding protein
MLNNPERFNADPALIEVRNLKTYYPVRRGFLQRVQGWVKALDDVSFDIQEGETLGLVGESGCGKTTLGHTLLRLIQKSGGEVRFRGENIYDLDEVEMKKMRRKMQAIFQDPYASLDPKVTVGRQITEGLRIHGIGDKREQEELSFELLRRVGLETHHAMRYPYEFSGGQRQRIGIARALALQPEFIVCDEPVSALDVSIQARILNLLKDLQENYGLTYLFVAHDMSVVENISHRVAVMYLGTIVELASREALFQFPIHPYTLSLMSAIPVANPHLKRQRIVLSGEVPSPVEPPSGCHFHPRCPVAMEHCAVQRPELIEVEPGHWAACWRVA